MEKKKLLIVDDEKDFADMVKQYLEQADGYDVRVENNPEKAFRTALKYEPDLILLDIIMPKKGGFEVLEELKKDENTLSIPVIILTALNQEPPKEKATEGYAEDYIVKPVSMAALKEKVGATLKRLESA